LIFKIWQLMKLLGLNSFCFREVAVHTRRTANSTFLGGAPF
jgi:hypothetical protein